MNFASIYIYSAVITAHYNKHGVGTGLEIAGWNYYYLQLVVDATIYTLGICALHLPHLVKGVRDLLGGEG